jgi:hypothetical protein
MLVKNGRDEFILFIFMTPFFPFPFLLLLRRGRKQQSIIFIAAEEGRDGSNRQQATGSTHITYTHTHGVKCH